MFDPIEEAIAEIRAGRMVVVVDDENRENEGDLVMAAEKVTPEAINFMAMYGRGLICLPLTRERLESLAIPPLYNSGGDHQGTAMMMPIDAAHGVTTGISAQDRAHTIRLATDPSARPEDFVRPGHVFPLEARDGGVLRRPGHTEAAVDLARLAGLTPAGVICEIMNEDGTMARLPQLEAFASRHGLKIISIADLIKFRRQREKLIRQIARVYLPTRHGQFELRAYEDIITRDIHTALIKGNPANPPGGRPPLVRVHSECLTGDVFASMRCDCGEQLARALQMINSEGCGVVLYMRQEGRGIGLAAKLKAYELQENGLDTVEANLALGLPADARDYGIGAQILAELGLSKIRLMTNNPRKFSGLAGYGLEIVERVPLTTEPNSVNAGYLAAKRSKLGHLF